MKKKSKKKTQRWRNGSMLKSTGCSSRGWGFNSFQYPHGSSQPTVSPVPGNLTPSSGPWEHQACKWCMYTHT